MTPPPSQKNREKNLFSTALEVISKPVILNATKTNDDTANTLNMVVILQ